MVQVELRASRGSHFSKCTAELQKEKNNSDKPKEELKRRNAAPRFKLGCNDLLRKHSYKVCLRTKFCTLILSRKPILKMRKEASDMLSADEK